MVLTYLSSFPAVIVSWVALEIFTSLFAFQGAMVLSFVTFAAAMTVLTTSAYQFTLRAEQIGERLGLNDLATGILIISIGTSAPEIFSSIGAIANEQPSLIIGNVFGTIIANTLLGVGLAAIFARRAIIVHDNVADTHSVVLLGACFLTILTLIDGRLSVFDSAIILIVLLAYIQMCAKEAAAKDHQKGRGGGTFKELLIPLGVGTVCLVILFRSGDLVIASMISGAVILGFPEIKAAATILAIGTSIPEIISAIVLALRGNTDAVFGEIIGSNLIALLGIFGFAGFFAGVALSGQVLWFLLGSVAATGILTYVIVSDKKVIWIEGLIFIALFTLWLQILVSL